MPDLPLRESGDLPTVCPTARIGARRKYASSAESLRVAPMFRGSAQSRRTRGSGGGCADVVYNGRGRLIAADRW